MNITFSARTIICALVWLYCRVIPVEKGKGRLMVKTRRLVTPYKAVSSLPQGGKIKTDLSDHVQRHIYFLGYYERRITDLVIQTLGSGDTFVDVGANVGYYTVIAGVLVGSGGGVHSFEPIPAIYEALQENVTLNGLDNVRLNRAALFEKEEELEIYLPGEANNGWGSMVKRPSPYHPGPAVRCPALSLDNYLRQAGIDDIRLIKLDIEGAELFALRGMQGVLSSAKPPDLICEADPELLEEAGHTPTDVIQFMESFGYQTRKIDRSNLHFTKTQH